MNTEAVGKGKVASVPKQHATKAYTRGVEMNSQLHSPVTLLWYRHCYAQHNTRYVKLPILLSELP